MMMMIGVQGRGSGPSNGWGCGVEKANLARSGHRIYHKRAQQEEIWARGNGKIWVSRYFRAELGTAQLHLNRIDSPCKSFESIQLMTQAAFLGIESIQPMTKWFSNELAQLKSWLKQKACDCELTHEYTGWPIKNAPSLDACHFIFAIDKNVIICTHTEQSIVRWPSKFRVDRPSVMQTMAEFGNAYQMAVS